MINYSPELKMLITKTTKTQQTVRATRIASRIMRAIIFSRVRKITATTFFGFRNRRIFHWKSKNKKGVKIRYIHCITISNIFTPGEKLDPHKVIRGSKTRWFLKSHRFHKHKIEKKIVKIICKVDFK